MEKRPHPMIASKQQNTYLYVFSYVGDPDDRDADISAFNTELAKHLLIGKSPHIAQNGFGVTGDDAAYGLTIGDDGGTGRTIELALASTDIGTTITYPVVYYKGVAIPFSDYSTVAAAKGKITLKSGTTTKYPSTDEDDYIVYYSDFVLGVLATADIGGGSLPLESTSYNAVGVVEPVLKTQKRGDAEQTGSLSFICSQTAIMKDGDSAPINNAGSELLGRIFGSQWTLFPNWPNRNQLNYNTNPFGICLLEHSGKDFNGGGQGEVWARIRFAYHCMLTSISSPQNVSQDSTDPILQNVEFTTKHSIPDATTLLCAG